MKHTYSPKKIGLQIGCATKTLQRWDREGILKVHCFLADCMDLNRNKILEMANEHENNQA